MGQEERERRFRAERARRVRAGVRLRKDTYREIARLLRQAEDQVRARLAQAPSEFDQFRLPQLQREIRQALREVERRSAELVAGGMGASWQAGLDLVDKPLEAGGIQISALAPQVSTAQLEAMRTFAVDRIRDVSVQLANRLASELALATIGSQSVGDTVRNIQRLFKRQGRRRALTIVRTELGRAFSVAGQKRREQAKQVLPGLKKQWRRSGKVHSRPGHDAIDGQIREVEQKFDLPNGVRLMVPRDPFGPAGETINCGCEALDYMESWEVKDPGPRPFTPEERGRGPNKMRRAKGIAAGD